MDTPAAMTIYASLKTCRSVTEQVLDRMAPGKVAVHYFSHNPLTVFSRYRKVKNKRQELFAIVNHGVLLGYIDPEHRIVNFGTIISNRSLSKRKRKWSYPCRHVLHELKENK